MFRIDEVRGRIGVISPPPPRGERPERIDLLSKINPRELLDRTGRKKEKKKEEKEEGIECDSHTLLIPFKSIL